LCFFAHSLLEGESRIPKINTRTKSFNHPRGKNAKKIPDCENFIERSEESVFFLLPGLFAWPLRNFFRLEN
jgi:hypothetical protein